MTTTSRPLPERRSFLQRHWKKFVGGIVGLVVLVIAASFVYVKFIKEEAPEAFDVQDVLDAVTTTLVAPQDTVTTTVTDSPTTVVGADPAATTTLPVPAATTTVAPETTTAETTATETPPTADGTWAATTASTLRYRVVESINGFDTEGVGETNQITGALTIAGTTATTADFVVDMTTFASNEGNRDRQFNGRIMSVDQFPTSSFVLTSPIEFGAIPVPGETVTATATGDLTLRGVTNSVTFDLTATLDNDRIGVLGNIPVVFADYSIPNPSFGTISTEDNGLLEFVLVFEPAAA